MLATRPETDTIAITRTFDGIESAAHRVISQLGGMASIIKDAKLAVLKPNFVAGRSSETGSTTSFALLKAVAEEVRSCGAEPVLCETPGTEFDREATYTILASNTSVPRMASALSVLIRRGTSRIGLN